MNPKYPIGTVVKIPVDRSYGLVSAKVVGFYLHEKTQHIRYVVEHLEGITIGKQEECYEDTINLSYSDHNPYSPNTLVRPAFNP